MPNSNNQKKYANLSTLQAFLDNLKTKFANIGHKHTISDITDYKVDDALSSTSTSPVQNKVLNAEFDEIAVSMRAIGQALDGKSDSTHNHDDDYAEKGHNHDGVYATAGHNHDSKYDVKGSAATVQENLDEVSDTLDTHTGNTDIHVTTANKSNWNSAYTHSTAAHARTDATKVEDSSTNGNIKINGTETNVYSHPNSGITAGIYKSVTVDSQGHVTAGSNPTTLSGFGITDAETKNDASAKLTEAKSYTDTVASSKSDKTHNHDSAYDTKGAAAEALVSAQSYTDTKTKDLASNTAVDNKITAHNTSDSAHNDIRDLISGLTNRLNTLANSDDTTLDQMSEVVAYIKNNKSLIDGITTNKVNVADIINNLTTNVTNKPLSAAQGVAIKNLIDTLQEELDSHIHPISDVSGLQSALDGKAPTEHGIHVGYSTTAPVMDGTASVGTASTVARSDHRHPTDTSRASKTEFDNHVVDTTKHITATERTNWNAAKSHADSAHDYLPLAGGTVTGTTIFSKSVDIGEESYTSPALVVGGNYTEPHLEIDNNEIKAKKNANETFNLFLNDDVPADGSFVGIGGSIDIDANGLEVGTDKAIFPEAALNSSVGTATLPFNRMFGRYFELYGASDKQYGRFRVGTTGTTSTAGVTTLELGNSTATGTANNASGKITMYGSGTGFTNILPNKNTSGSNSVYLPTTSGTLATVENSTKVATMSTAEYNALPTEQVDANTLYMLTDTEEEVIPQIQIITWGADD